MNAQHQNLLSTLKARFEKNRHRHVNLDWNLIQKKLEQNPTKILSLEKMEETGGEPDVIDFDKKSGEYIFVDCSTESPKGRRSLCYDNDALESRKVAKPHGSALGMAIEMSIQILTESEYRKLQELGEFDTKTSSWVKTPDEIRKLGGAVFADRRYNSVFLYHNGAESYYAARGFRGCLRV